MQRKKVTEQSKNRDLSINSEEIPAEAKDTVPAEQKLSSKERNLTANPGDRIADEPQTIEEKAKQIAVDVPDITGDHIKVPTYFIVEYPNGEKKALHHVKDAEEISDVIRQARMDENGNRIWW
ncbi:hypothetical protein Ple7327_2969 [Pleurocapsa sp. PCC 7327]|uniref:hypothetical protein n=1 Tax=Pleurocapsa sp. PCC 7327 TaxID=118163 RepID=UPI00029FDACB|nr:hypothetical protein [Pleurocapsa sp. PCC 7327]AFY78206.1 hypothetical protein Ple7327_2969 [Pleurocapsa sp. PCC 7327]